jgi:hypothetical protein
MSRIGFRMQFERYAERGRRALARVVVGRRADAAGRKHDVAGGERTAQRRRDALRIVADVFRPRERQPAFSQKLDNLRQMLVGASARQDFVADDDDAKCHCRLLFRKGFQ